MLNSADPNSFSPNQNTGNQAGSGDDNLMMKPLSTAIPGPNPMNTQELGSNQDYKGTMALTKATQQGDQAIASAASKGGGGGGAGGIFGAVGSILGGLFSQGGPVGMAAGGQVDNDNDALATGYLIGALHQSKFGGTPDTLQNAAAVIKQMLMDSEGMGDRAAGINGQREAEMLNQGFPIPSLGKDPYSRSGRTMEGTTRPSGFAQGGDVANGTNQQNTFANQQLLDALGITGGQNSPQQVQPAQAQQEPTPQQSQMPQGMQNSMMSGNPNPMRGYAAGGPDMPMAPEQGPKPLAPGQAFQGDGAVKGPGGPEDDAIPAKLSNGEFVISAPATAFFGVDKLTKMNEQGKQGFMQAKAQVDQNQQQGSGMPPGAPGAPPMAAPPQGAGMMAPPQMPPMQAAKGGAAVLRTKGSGYMGC